jgi:hypothetical protein
MKINREGNCPYRNICESYLPLAHCMEELEFQYCGLYIKRLNIELMEREERQRLEEMALTSCDMITLKRLMGVVR